jgi:hypothetical protein
MAVDVRHASRSLVKGIQSLDVSLFGSQLFRAPLPQIAPTMKLFPCSILVIFLATMGSTMAGMGVRVVFNRGIPDPNKWCSAGDWSKVQMILDGAMGGRRLGDTQRHSRQLQGAFCQSVCRSFPPGLCYLSGTGCRYRRALEDPASDQAPLLAEPDAELTEDPSSRHLYADSLCKEKKKSIVKILDTIQTAVAQTCRNLITSEHDLACYDV